MSAFRFRGIAESGAGVSRVGVCFGIDDGAAAAREEKEGGAATRYTMQGTTGRAVFGQDGNGSLVIKQV